MDLVALFTQLNEQLNMWVDVIQSITLNSPQSLFFAASSVVFLALVFTTLYNMAVRSGFGRRAYALLGVMLMFTLALEFEPDSLIRGALFGLSVQFIGALLVAYIFSDQRHLVNGVALLMALVVFIVPAVAFLAGGDLAFVVPLQLELFGLFIAFGVLFEEVRARRRNEQAARDDSENYQTRYQRLVKERDKWGKMLVYMRRDAGANYRIAALQLLRQRAVTEQHDNLIRMYDEALEIERENIERFTLNDEPMISSEDEAADILPVQRQPIRYPHDADEPYTGDYPVYDEWKAREVALYGEEPEPPQYAYPDSEGYVEPPQTADYTYNQAGTYEAESYTYGQEQQASPDYAYPPPQPPAQPEWNSGLTEDGSVWEQGNITELPTDTPNNDTDSPSWEQSGTPTEPANNDTDSPSWERPEEPPLD